ncbi:IS481 family transposase [Streptomyces sp. NBC_01451]|uniref:IS481 family transposase n=1 Tax=Streptomyces sp. NBC_01451 TaxID=2903872 RepID=UPI002E375631|nr:IS481 family transposase [Streptomyces sp. NBC_01451]
MLLRLAYLCVANVFALLRLHGELLVLGVKVAASTVWEILMDAGIPPTAELTSSTWEDSLRSQADALPAGDFFETITLSRTRLYVFTVIGDAGRRTRILGATTHPTASWAAQSARNLVIDLEDTGCEARYVIRDRHGKFPELFDTILADPGIEVVLSGIRIPRMNSVIERWVQTCRRELLDRTLIWNQHHLLHALREFEQFNNAHRPYQGIANTCPLHPLPEPITDHRSGRDRPPRHTSNRPTRRPPSRVPACCATRPDEGL